MSEAGWFGGRLARWEAGSEGVRLGRRQRGQGALGPSWCNAGMWHPAHHVEHGEEDREGDAHALGEDLCVEEVEADVQSQPRDQYYGGGD